MLQRLRPLDFILIMVWALIIANGARTGVIRQVLLLLAVYIGAVFAGGLYKQGGDALAYPFGGLTVVNQTRVIAYAILLLLGTAVLAFLTWVSYRNTALLSHPRLDTGLGTVVAGVWGIFLLIGVVVILRFYSLDTTLWPGQEENQRSVDLEITASQLVPMLKIGAAPMWAAMEPWFPEPLKAR